MAKTLKEMMGPLASKGVEVAPSRQSSKIKNQNGTSADEADFIDKQISGKKIADRNGNGEDVFSATNVSQSPPLKGKNPDSPDGVYEELMVRMKAQTYHKDKGEWTQHAETGKVRGVSRKHILDKAIKKIQTKYPDEKEHEATIVKEDGTELESAVMVENSVEYYDALERERKANWHYSRAGKNKNASLKKGIENDYEAQLLKRGVKDSNGNQMPLQRKPDPFKQQPFVHDDEDPKSHGTKVLKGVAFRESEDLDEGTVTDEFLDALYESEDFELNEAENGRFPVNVGSEKWDHYKAAESHYGQSRKAESLAEWYGATGHKEASASMKAAASLYAQLSKHHSNIYHAFDAAHEKMMSKKGKK